jgi:hypothetical protein
MALATSDEIRVVALEVFVLAMRDLINSRIDHSDRQFFANREVYHTPPPEE